MLFNKLIKTQLKHVIKKAIQCTLLSICVLLNMLRVLCDLIFVTTSQYYDELLPKVKINHNVRKIGLLKR